MVFCCSSGYSKGQAPFVGVWVACSKLVSENSKTMFSWIVMPKLFDTIVGYNKKKAVQNAILSQIFSFFPLTLLPKDRIFERQAAGRWGRQTGKRAILSAQNE